MLVILSCVNREEWRLFDKKGNLVPIAELMERSAGVEVYGEYRTVGLPNGEYWLIQKTPPRLRGREKFQICYHKISDTPSSPETKHVVKVPFESFFNDESPEKIRNKLEKERKKQDPVLQYPLSLVEYVVKLVADYHRAKDMPANS